MSFTVLFKRALLFWTVKMEEKNSLIIFYVVWGLQKTKNGLD